MLKDSGDSAGDPPSAATNERLAELSLRFQSFERQVEADAKSKKVSEEATTVAAMAGVGQLDEALAADSQSAYHDMQKLQAALEPKITETQARIEASFLEQFENLHSLIDALSDRTAAVEKDFVAARSHYISEMEQESKVVDADLAEFKKAFKLEVESRKEREANLLKELEESERKAAAKLDRDEHMAGRKYAQLLRDAEDSVVVWDAASKKFKEQVESDLSSMKIKLEEVSKARVQADDDIVAALDHYTKELQKAVSYVSQGQVKSAASGS
eukprot:TRINITY_DN88152_c0_g1_i1.p1 TRINITY_DN88152_c0_g1~~TRINITY_DN88152_c0_g1_i1.p1  ORF type:complete len:272 (-),score=86.94 TRINITY_DN88152_c0_g1_i1:50-865(-)